MRRIARWAFGDFGAVVSQYLKYQLVVQALLALVVLPVYALSTVGLLAGRSDEAVTNANLLAFLLTPRGAGFALVAATVLVVGVLLELGGFITIAARARHGAPESPFGAIVRLTFSRGRRLLSPAGLLVLVYIAVIVPLTGVGVGVSFLQGVKVPRFITAVIETTPVYAAAALAAVAVLLIAGLLAIYTIHVIILEDRPAGAALLRSARLVRRHPRTLLRAWGRGIVAQACLAAPLLLFTVVLAFAAQQLDVDRMGTRVTLLVVVLVQQVATVLLAWVTAPLLAHLLTDAFYEASQAEGAEVVTGYPRIAGKEAASALDRLLARRRTLFGIGAVVLVALAAFSGAVFDQVARAGGTAEVVAHRAGGFARPENSLSGLRYAIDVGAAGTEIDVQRTRDGAYILNHDETFARVAGDGRRARDMTLAEVRQLNLSSTPGQVERVPTLTEFLTEAKGRIRVFVELKGSTADERMAADTIALARRLGMLDQVVVISLDYELIKAIEARWPQVETGFLYFLSIGDASQLVGDYIILEEGEATDERVAGLQAAGKRPIVWTVNTEESMDEFVDKDVVGLITDEPARLKERLAQRRAATTGEVLRDLILAG